MKRIVSSLALLVAAATPLVAQTPTQGGADLVDRVVAVVGDTALLLSDVQAAIQQMEAQGQQIPNDPIQRDALARQVLESKVNDLVVIEAARDAGTTPDEEAIRARVDSEIRTITQRIGGDAAFAQALARDGLTLAQYRAILEQQYRDEQLRNDFLRARMANRARPLISEEQLREAFRQYEGQLGTRPATVSFRQVIVKPEPTDSALQKARATAEDVYNQLQAGGDWEVIARRFSADPGSKERGGDIGWFKQGKGLVKEFEDMAFALRPGMVSPIVKSEFGFHVIEVQQVRGPERRIRHVLIKPEITDADVQRARQRADSVATAIRGGANPLALARAYGTSSLEAEATRFPVPELPPTYREAVQGATVGSVVGPVALESPLGRSWAVLRVDAQNPEGPITLDDVREQLTQRLQEGRMMEQLVTDLRRSVYVQVLR